MKKNKELIIIIIIIWIIKNKIYIDDSVIIIGITIFECESNPI